ncbi:DNA repair protein XRCC4 [Dillenia turbinata]|uniref:DNA repair protein XRCC4 n=1 Tax=Dillenia turbinata TaxID=194707 RepID=A0AAN8UEM3_9MAGN
MDSTRHTCLKLSFTDKTEGGIIFIKGTWFPTHFNLSITDGLNAWICNASEDEVRERANQWDQPVSDYIDFAERYLGFQQPGSVYKFEDAGNGNKRPDSVFDFTSAIKELSWTFEKEGTRLEWRWKCQISPDNKKTTAGILDFLMDANIRLSEETVRKTQSFDRLKVEAEKCLAQSERFNKEKAEFENLIYAKFVKVLNSKKEKLRDLREQLAKREATGKQPLEEENSTDKTESFDEGSDDDKS